VAVHTPTATAVVADLHLGYHAARRRRGEAVPVPALGDVLAPLAAVLRRRSLRRIVVAGALFEDGVVEAVLAELDPVLGGHRAAGAAGKRWAASPATMTGIWPPATRASRSLPTIFASGAGASSTATAGCPKGRRCAVTGTRASGSAGAPTPATCKVSDAWSCPP